MTCLIVFNHYGVHSSTASGPPSLQGKAMVLIAPKICFGEVCLKPSISDLSVSLIPIKIENRNDFLPKCCRMQRFMHRRCASYAAGVHHAPQACFMHRRCASRAAVRFICLSDSISLRFSLLFTKKIQYMLHICQIRDLQIATNVV